MGGKNSIRLTQMLLVAALIGAGAGFARAEIAVKLGVLNDRFGVYADFAGEGSVIAAQMAVEDRKAAEKGIKVDASKNLANFGAF